MRLIVGGIALLFCSVGVAAAGPHTFQGRRLDDALRLLQRDGLPIVFSSAIVTPRMRVTAEPRATTPQQQLDELLEPHGLTAESGPGGVILVVRRRPVAPSPPAPAAPATRHVNGASAPAPPRPATYTDDVTVSSRADGQPSVDADDTTLDRTALESTGSGFEADGLAAIRAMPRVSATDDFRSDFSVRGSPYRQIGIVIDGVPTPWLQHTIYGRNDVGSIAMFGNDSLDRATLQSGAYPRLDEDALGAQLDLSLREGSRASTRVAGTVGGMTTGFVGEGPIGSGRGSWIAGFRSSYHSWPPGERSLTNAGFLFADLHAKLVYDVSPRQQVSLTALGGQSTLDTLDELLRGQTGTGTDHAGLLTAGWQSTLGAHTVVRQRLFVVGQNLDTALTTGQVVASSRNRSFGYRGEALHTMFGGLLEAGADVTRLSGARNVGAAAAAAGLGTVGAAWMTHAAYVDFSHAAPGGLSFEAGARVSDSTLVRRHVLAPWLLGAWRFGRAWRLTASTGASRQFADLDAVLGAAGPSPLLPERATHVDLGVEHPLATGIKWQATLFERVEHDVLRGPDAAPGVTEGAIAASLMPGGYRNALSGTSRGLELVVTPEHTGRASGWLSYTYALARQHDVVTHETFWSDLDRRHTFNAAGMFRLGSQTSAGLVLRAASGVPIPGYFDLRNGTLVAGDRLNHVRLPAYVRLDAHMQRTLFSPSHRVTVFGEIVNALNRRNEGIALGSIQPFTGEAVGFSQPLVPRRMSIGIQIDFSR